MEFDDVVRKRRMVHRFESTPVPDDVLRDVLETALHAPSAGYSQALQLVVIRGQDSLARFWQLTDPNGETDEVLGVSTTGPRALVLVLTDAAVYTERYAEPDKADAGMAEGEQWPVPYWYVDAGMAGLLILQAAVNRGLGAWFFGVVEGERELRESLGIPSGLLLIGVIGLGYQSADDRPIGSAVSRPRRSLDETLHAEVW